jgi:hypothetical protein
MTLRKPTVYLAFAAALIAGPGAAQDASHVQPSSYRVTVDNDQIRVLEFRSKPGMGVCGAGLHSHPPHLTVLLTPARVRVTENGKTQVIESKTGDTFWSPAVTHEVENYGGQEVRSVIIEIKNPRKAQ